MDSLVDSVYDQIEIEDFTFDSNTQLFQYPCPCGDKFQICLEDLKDGEEIAICPSCSLMVQIIYDQDDLSPFIQQVSYSQTSFSHPILA
ncbi:Kti11p [Ascoidea rubescens DSM 1968]|uniref:Diphthamide biosynthesis protein 3 n=1 Tax=Ascoidea rubescens DSM 1968 TaxID=1344418 RepID=A0A1D2VMH0_9ASCO|nr:Zn-ribbon protein [Ascoidea rubescens DSM 1968]ODV62757.1 Zn-ribbon protein [Ascoidea rubescens DSM 1968]